mmetsp:Transcript_87883/g.246835  ORF Transcript_87883/g.246835 Transcript_87883/m.246835 type:complete len:254 (+) Transcript_87883:969-1730(+)
MKRLPSCNSLACLRISLFPRLKETIFLEIASFAETVARIFLSCCLSFCSNTAFCLAIFAAFSICTWAMRASRIVACELMPFKVSDAELIMLTTDGNCGDASELDVATSAAVSASSGTTDTASCPEDATSCAEVAASCAEIATSCAEGAGSCADGAAACADGAAACSAGVANASVCAACLPDVDVGTTLLEDWCFTGCWDRRRSSGTPAAALAGIGSKSAQRGNANAMARHSFIECAMPSGKTQRAGSKKTSNA